ncbi:hypothetical protein SAMD00023353_3300580 [Rosellinia necatrix]|uniref:Uncharacterized protein n=1 Tax=Rosellinia necatrix TaxID=77044 RepID=A0A1S8A8Q4_ROSNE|nr:hypothetical protein SAMD00023353_3300580 [Rosellinia necatrix]
MAGLINSREVVEDALTTTILLLNDAGDETKATPLAQVTRSAITQIRKAKRETTISPTQSQSPSASKDEWNGWDRPHGWTRSHGWTYGADAGPWHWGGTSTAVPTLTTVVTTKPTTIVGVTPSPSRDPMTSGTQNHGINISGAAAAGIGVGVSVGLLGIIIAVFYLHVTYSRQRKGKSPLGQASDNVEGSDDKLWPPYPHPASNTESPVELSAAQAPKEMCAQDKPQEKDASGYQGIAEWR